MNSFHHPMFQPKRSEGVIRSLLHIVHASLPRAAGALLPVLAFPCGHFRHTPGTRGENALTPSDRPPINAAGLQAFRTAGGKDELPALIRRPRRPQPRRRGSSAHLHYLRHGGRQCSGDARRGRRPIPGSYEEFVDRRRHLNDVYAYQTGALGWRSIQPGQGRTVNIFQNSTTGDGAWRQIGLTTPARYVTI